MALVIAGVYKFLINGWLSGAVDMITMLLVYAFLLLAGLNAACTARAIKTAASASKSLLPAVGTALGYNLGANLFGKRGGPDQCGLASADGALSMAGRLLGLAAGFIHCHTRWLTLLDALFL